MKLSTNTKTNTITIATPHGAINGLLATPTGDGPWPAILVLHDVTGSSKDLQRITETVAAHGYVALAPDLYSRGGPLRCITSVIANLLAGRGRAIDDIMAAREYLQQSPLTTVTMGIVGFCMGGGFALAVSTRGFDACAPFYGTVPVQARTAFAGACPIVASFGRRDPLRPLTSAKRLQKALQRNDIEHDVEFYSGVGHSFANQLPAQPLMRITGFGYSPHAEARAWQRVYAFFDHHLSH